MRILDLDNCIADDAWRVPFIDWKAPSIWRRYHKYHSLAAFDRCGNRRLLSFDEPTAIFTARPIWYRELTEEWLARNDVPYQHLLMRNNEDERPSTALKLTQLRWLLQHYGVNIGEITVAYDDRPDVVGMYLAEGIRAEVAFIHHNVNYGPHGPSAA